MDVAKVTMHTMNAFQRRQSAVFSGLFHNMMHCTLFARWGSSVIKVNGYTSSDTFLMKARFQIHSKKFGFNFPCIQFCHVLK